MHKNILITGVSGSGKSTVAAELVLRGHHAVDMDEEFCTMYYKETKQPVVTDFYNNDLPWVKSVEWLCDTEKLRKLFSKQENVYCCGSANNIQDLIPLFDAVVLLHVDEDTFRQRLTHRTNNDWGKTPDVQDWLLHQKTEFEECMLKHGAVVINAHQDIKNVVADILAIAHA